MPEQLDMFGAPTPAAKPRREGKGPFATQPRKPGRAAIEDRFAEFAKGNPHVLPEMLILARKRLDKGERRIGAKALWEELRSWLRTTGQPYKLDNSFTALYARELVKFEPRLEGVIEFRQRRTK